MGVFVFFSVSKCMKKTCNFCKSRKKCQNNSSLTKPAPNQKKRPFSVDSISVNLLEKG